MKLKCNVCEDSPTVELPKAPEHDEDMQLCPSCGKQMAWAWEDRRGELFWHPVDTEYNHAWGGTPVTIVEA